MKNTIIYCIAILFLLTALPMTGNAQEKLKPRIGVKGGVNFSTLYTKNSDNSKMLTGFNLGLFAKLPVTKTISLQPEFYYTTKGSEVTYNNLFANGTARFNVNYLEVPLLLMMNVTQNFNVHVGPYAGFMVSGKATNQSNVTLFNYQNELSTSDYNRLDAGIAAGVGIDVGALSIGARYSYGLTKVGKDHNFLGTTYRFPDASNSVMNFYIGIALN